MSRARKATTSRGRAAQKSIKAQEYEKGIQSGGIRVWSRTLGYKQGEEGVLTVKQGRSPAWYRTSESQQGEKDALWRSSLV